MVDVLLYNLHRLHDLWPVFVEHVVEVLGDPRPGTRLATLDALGKAVGGCLVSVVPSSNQKQPPAMIGKEFPAPPPRTPSIFQIQERLAVNVDTQMFSNGDRLFTKLYHSIVSCGTIIAFWGACQVAQIKMGVEMT